MKKKDGESRNMIPIVTFDAEKTTRSKSQSRQVFMLLEPAAAARY